ncbi:hypothetical protein ASD47_24325 [Caulobacter sp. Root1472]|nr:hypothetical protein ASD47_24325 [Caulobacter sp. Root1472]
MIIRYCWPFWVVLIIQPSELEIAPPLTTSPLNVMISPSGLMILSAAPPCIAPSGPSTLLNSTIVPSMSV